MMQCTSERAGPRPFQGSYSKAAGKRIGAAERIPLSTIIEQRLRVQQRLSLMAAKDRPHSRLEAHSSRGTSYRR
jgi:hypothetical protein